jgi:hypothetical protein
MCGWNCRGGINAIAAYVKDDIRERISKLCLVLELVHADIFMYLNVMLWEMETERQKAKPSSIDGYE